MDQPFILCGLGRVGWRVLEYLRAAGLSVVAVDTDCDPGDPRLAKVRLVKGDCRNREVLEQAGVRTARGVLILTSDDLINISAALTVRHLSPEVRVVVRAFNQNLIARLGKAVRNVFPLSVSGLAAPLLALTALTGEALGTLGLEEDRHQITEAVVRPGSKVRGLTLGEVAERYRVQVVAYLPASGPERFLLEVDPSARLAARDRLVVCGDPLDLAQLLAQLQEETLPHLLWAGWLRRSGRTFLRTFTEVELPVKICTAVLLFVMVSSTLVYRLGIMTTGDKTWADAFYRTISVMATGADMHEQELFAWWQKVFVGFLRVAGAALIAAFTAIVSNYLIRARLGMALELRRVPDGGHIVVCGLGNIGFRVVEELRRHDQPVVVIERAQDSRFLATARRQGVAVIIGDATVMEVLRQANVPAARAVVAATDNELGNLEVALLARELNASLRVVVRLTDDYLAQTLREAADVRYAVSIPALAAPAFLAALFGDRVPSVFMIRGRLLAAIDVSVQADDTFLLGQSLRALAIDHGLMPVAVTRGERPLPAPLLEQRLAAGDHLTAIATLGDLERLLRREPVPHDWAVDVTAVPDAARPHVVQLLGERQGLSAEAAAEALNRLPACVGNGLTRGQAEDLFIQLLRQNVGARPRQMAG